jgi:succinoglycan biosynthesis transport protein ExoP
MNQAFDLHFYWTLAKRRLPLFILISVAVAVAGAVVVMSMPAVYVSSAKILVESQQIPTDLVRSTVTSAAGERIQVIQQRVMTRDNLLALADKFKLFAERSDLSRSDIVDLMRDRTVIRPLSVGAGRSRNNAVTIAFAISFEYENPILAAKVANELVTLVLDEDVRGRASRATETTKFLSGEEKRLADELDLVQAEITKLKDANPNALPEKLAFNMGLLERTETLVASLDRDIQAQVDQRRMFELEAEVRRVSASGTGGLAPQSIGARIEAVKAEITQKLALYSETHPEVRALRKVLSGLEKERDAQVAALANKPADPQPDATKSIEERLLAEKFAAIEARTKILRDQREKALATVEAIKATIDSTPQVATALSDLNRREQALRKNLDDITAKLAEARLGERLEESQQAERFEVIEQATAPQEPVKPQRMKLLAVVALMAGFAGVASSAGLEILDSSIKRGNDIVSKLNQRPLVVIPYITTQGEKRRRRFKFLLMLLAVLIMVIGGLVGAYLFVPNIDVIFYTYLNKFF